MNAHYVSEVERMFYQDVREKKIAGYGAFHMRGKGKKHGTYVSLPSDQLTASQKKKLNGKVERYNVYQSLQTIEEFQKNPDFVQKQVFSNWRKFHDNETIRTSLGIGKKRFYELLEELGIEKKRGRTVDTTREAVPHEGIPTKEEFDTLSFEDQKEMLAMLRKEFKTEDVKKAWAMSTGGFYKLVADLGLTTSGPNSQKKKKIDMAYQLGQRDVIPYKTYQKLVPEQQKELLDFYKVRYPNQKDLAELWGISVTTIYGLNTRLKNVEYTPTPKEDIIKAKPPEPEEKKIAATPEPVKQNPTLLELAAQLEEENAPQVQEEIAPVAEEPTEAAEPVQTNALEEMIAKLSAQLEQQAEQIAELKAVNIPTQAAPIVQAAPVAQQEPQKQSEGFTMNYEKTQEGFLTHAEIKRFISVLEKNPDTFNVKISITKIEE